MPRSTPEWIVLDKAIPEPNSGCWLWAYGVQSMGYGCWTTKGGWKLAHRMAYEITRGPIPKNMVVCHSCDIPLCINPDHLFLGSQKDNIRDAVKKGRMKLPRLQGEKHNQAKLSNIDVGDIRKSNLPITKIAAKYSVSKQTISYIKNRKTWRHIP